MTNQTDKKLNEYRKQIDVIDETIIEKIGQRFEVVKAIGQLKKEAGIEVLDSSRESKVLVKMNELAIKYNVPIEVVIHIYDYLMSESKKMQK